ncbi:UDP-N-acetylglucosamine 2-epimerase (non-hydrolyzing) [Planctomycetota bacterium]|nr:UDP-N-acetylglucosamine 2-epimerase (non-hydrolyzing) [Planctomycetota bacterium]
MKLVTILGARPQFVKAGTVSRAILNSGPKIEEVIVHTGQHYDSNMSDVFFEEMKIPKPNHFLAINGGSHGSMTGQMLERIEEVLLTESPDMVMVYGDTNSTLAGALAASKLHIPIAHVEAGLRSFNNKMPEEINRILTDRVSSLLFCPTQNAVDNLVDEGVENWGGEVVLSGDVMQDGANYYRELSVAPSGLKCASDFILCTVHRAENTDSLERLSGIVAALRVLAESTQVVMPLHPRTKRALSKHSLELTGVTLIEPAGYLNMIWLIDNCSKVLTDSGGLQKEAFFFGKPCVTMRDETEWVELVDNKFNVLSGASAESIITQVSTANFSSDFAMNLYGQGNASRHIIQRLLNV